MIHPITAQLKGYTVDPDYRVDLQDFWSGKGPWLEKRHECGPSDNSEGPYGSR